MTGLDPKDLLNNVLISIVGPTGIGKTGVAIDLAKRYNSVVVSADSRQVYQELRVGSNQPDSEEMGGIKHYFVGDRALDKEFTAGKFEIEVMALLDREFSEYNPIFMCGGSGLYVQAAIEGLDEIPEVNPAIRDELQSELDRHGLDRLRHELQQVDPKYFEVVDTDNPRRVIRALEVYRSTGKPISYFLKGYKKERNFKCIRIGLNTDRDKLYRAINHRVDQMMENGLVEEARGLVDLRHVMPLQTVGYQELFPYFEGLYDLDHAVALIKRNTRRYAKRQLTWFKADQQIKWFEPQDIERIDSHILDALRGLAKY